MCNLTQFIGSYILTGTRAETLSKNIMEKVMLNFGMVDVVVIDADSRFRITFEAMCFILKWIFQPLSHEIHKGNRVECYHLNKT